MSRLPACGRGCTTPPNIPAPVAPTDLRFPINLATAPDVQTCVLTLLGVGLVLTVVAAFIFAGREFRMKTPAGN